MADQVDVRFEALVRDVLRTEVATLPLTVTPADVLRRAAERRRERARGRVRLLLLAAVLLLPLGGLLAFAMRPQLPPAADYEAVLVRGLRMNEARTATSDLEVVVATADGTARSLARVPASRLGAVERSGGPASISTQGWLALGAHSTDERASEKDIALDLRRLDREPLIFDGSGVFAWDRTGFLWRRPSGLLVQVNPETGEATSIPQDLVGDLVPWPFGAWAINVAADGSGVLVGDPGNRVVDDSGEPYAQSWAIVTAQATVVPGAPELAYDVGRRFLSPHWGLLQLCDPESSLACPGRATGSLISGPAADGSYRNWGEDPPLHDHVIGASWAADGGVWVLVDRRTTERALVLVHRDEQDVDTEIASFLVGADDQPTFDAFAPDDSLIAIGFFNGHDEQTVLVDTASGRAHRFEGSAAGFLPVATADEWLGSEDPAHAGEPVVTSGSASSGASEPYPPLPELTEQLDSTAGAPVLLVHEVPASAVDPGSPVGVLLGPVALDVGYGISLVCSGPGEVTYSVVGPTGNESPVTRRCLDRFPDDQGAPNVEGGTIQVEVTADPSTTWRLIVYDPPPSSLRQPSEETLP